MKNHSESRIKLEASGGLRLEVGGLNILLFSLKPPTSNL
jgi:hypothetical protein